jgi:hypothetical protein
MSKYLTKKGHKGGLERSRSIAPMQGRQGKLPSMGMGAQPHESLNNTKAPMTKQMPQGVAHAKKVSNSPTAPGQYL